MNRFILFALLITAFSYSTDTTACVVLPNNTLNVVGPTTVCASDPNGSYDVRFTTGIDGNPYQLFLAVQGGTVTNIQGYTNFGGVPSPGTCVPAQTFSIVTPCNIDQVYDVLPSCSGGIRFDVDWSTVCPFENNLIEAVLFWNTGDITRQVYPVIDLSCTPTGGDDRSMRISQDDTANSLQNSAVDIFPNPTSDAEVTIKIPSAYENSDIRITDINGKQIKHFVGATEQLTVNTSDLNDSVYFVHVISADGKTSSTKKLIISK